LKRNYYLLGFISITQQQWEKCKNLSRQVLSKHDVCLERSFNVCGFADSKLTLITVVWSLAELSSFSLEDTLERKLSLWSSTTMERR